MQRMTRPIIEKRLEFFKQICKSHNIKLTPQRLIIYEELIQDSTHPSTDMLYQRIQEKFPTISFDTVHRTLLMFYEIGVANIIEGTGNPKRFDGNVDKHHHFQCLTCKTIIDIHETAYDDLPISDDIRNTCEVLRQTVRLEGLCKECR